jgi:hypothetical protein
VNPIAPLVANTGGFDVGRKLRYPTTKGPGLFSVGGGGVAAVHPKRAI